jgi:hypothetical protein
MSTSPSPLLVCLLSVTVLVGCSAVPSAPIAQVPPEVVTAPNEIVVGNATLRLDIYPYRNFQPGISPDTRLIVGFQIGAGAGSIPTGLRAEKAWIVRENEGWISTPRQEQPPFNASQVEYVSRAGPEWPVGAVVTGVLQLRDASNHSYLLRSTPRAIGRAD